MSLTKQDLRAIKQLIDESNDRLEVKLVKRIDELDDTLSRQTAAGFTEVHTRIDALQQTVDRIDRTLQIEVKRNDFQDDHIKHIRESLHAA